MIVKVKVPTGLDNKIKKPDSLLLQQLKMTTLSNSKQCY